MDFCENLLEAMEASSNTLDHNLSLIERYMEMTYVEFSQKKESAELRYVSEAQSEDALCTLSYLYTEAEEGFEQKVVATFEKIMDTIKLYIMDAQNALNALIVDKLSSKVLKKLDKKVNANPFLKNTKVEWFRYNERYLLYFNFIDLYNQATKYSQIGDLESLKEIADKMDSQIKIAMHADSVLHIEDTLQNVLNMLKEESKETVVYFKECEKGAKEILSHAKKLSSASKSSEILRVWQRIGILISRSVKITMNTHLNFLIDGLRAVENASDEKMDESIRKAAGKARTERDEDERLREQAKKKDMSGEGYIRESNDTGFDDFMKGMFESFLSNPVVDLPELEELSDDVEYEESPEDEDLGLNQMIESALSSREKFSNDDISISSLAKDFGYDI